MNILITGGAGLVGSHAAEYFAGKGHNVTVMDNLIRSKLFGYDKKSVEYNWDYLSRIGNVKRVIGDVRDEGDVLSAVGRGVDVLLHAAGQPGVPLSMKIPKEDFSINGFGTLNVLECLRQKSPEAVFIYTSTNKVYGENVDMLPLKEGKTRYGYSDVRGVDENMSVDNTGHTPYGASKYVGDLYAQEYGRFYGMKTGIFRMSCVYGTRQFGFEEQGWVSWFGICAVYGKPITIFGDGKQVRDLLWVEDLVKAFDCFIGSGLKGEVFNIGGGDANSISLLEFLDVLEKKVGRKPDVSFKNWRQSDQKVYISDIRKIKKTLGWSPEVSAQEGIDRLLGWIKENGVLFNA